MPRSKSIGKRRGSFPRRSKSCPAPANPTQRRRKYGARESEAIDHLTSTTPTTLQGLLALVTYINAVSSGKFGNGKRDNSFDESLYDVLASVERLLAERSRTDWEGGMSVHPDDIGDAGEKTPYRIVCDMEDDAQALIDYGRVVARLSDTFDNDEGGMLAVLGWQIVSLAGAIELRRGMLFHALHPDRDRLDAEADAEAVA